MKALFASGLVCLIAGIASADAGNVVLQAKLEQANFQLVSVVEGLDKPSKIAFLPGGELLVTESTGKLIVHPHNGEPVTLTVVDDLPKQGGLRGVSLHPDFENNSLMYFCYGQGSNEANQPRLIRGTFTGTNIENVEELFVADSVSKELGHISCRMLWLDDGTLLVTLGDRYYELEQAQNPANLYGTVVRLNDDGSIPADNPFIDTDGFRPEVWAWGIRNTQGADVHPDTGQVWSADHGPYGGDEINILDRGKNYGWAAATYGIDYDKTIISDKTEIPGAEPPLYYWYPSIAPSSVAFYTGSEFPKWRGDLFIGAMAKRTVLRLELRGDRVIRVEDVTPDLNIRIRDVAMSPDGRLHILTDHGDGRVLRVEPWDPPPEPAQEEGD